MDVNRGAPVFSEGSIEVAAPPETLWDLMADVRGWPTWNPDVDRVSVEREVAEGTIFRWKAGAATITSTIRLVERPNAIGWTGRTFGIDAIHVWRFEPRGDSTIASMQESFDGIVAKLLRGRLQRQLDATTKSGLENLKKAAEARSPA